MPSQAAPPSSPRTGEKTPRFVFVVLPSLCDPIREGVERFRERFGDRFEVSFHLTETLEDPDTPLASVRQSLSEADVIIAAYHGGKASAVISSSTRDTTQPVILLYGGSPDMMGLLRMGSFSLQAIFAKTAARKPRADPKRKQPTQPGRPPNPATFQKILRVFERVGSILPFGKLRHVRNWSRALRYWEQGGPENISGMLQFIGREYAGLRLPRPAPPGKEPDTGLYDPFSGRRFLTTEAYRKAVGHDPDRPTVGVLLHGGSKLAQTNAPVRSLASVLLNRHRCNVLPVFSSPEEAVTAISTFFNPGGKPAVDAVVSLRWFRLTQFSSHDPDAGVDALKTLGVPVFNGAPMFGRKVSDWRESTQGFAPFETLSAVILPELDGLVEPLPLAGLEEVEDASLGGTLARVVAVEERVERMASRLDRLFKLQRLANGEKRVAFVIYNTPPGEDNIGNAAYLDTFESLRRLLHEMKARGYHVEDVPEPGRFHERFIERGMVNQARWGGEDKALAHGPEVTTAEYESWLAKLPEGSVLEAVWGRPPGSIMVEQGRFLLPALAFGHVLVAIQPYRGGGEEDADKIAHDQTLPPHHQYTAFYRWLEEQWRPDAMVHVGTHGTLEFLKGKEVGMSRDCWPEMLLGDVPHLYIYHVVNASEAIIVKRRTLGTCVNYNTAAFASSGLYDEYATLEDLIAEHAEARGLDPARALRLEGAIRDKAAELKFTQGTLAEVHEELMRMKRSIIPKGLHVFGEDIDPAGRLDFATFVLRYERGPIASLHRLLAEARGWDYQALLASPVVSGPDGIVVNALEQVDGEARELVREAMVEGHWPENAGQRAAVEFALATAAQLGGRLEWENLFAGLEGRFIEPGLGGDPLRNPEVLPTGRNSFQFDPALVPSDDAIERGALIAENTLKHYQEAHGCYPRSTAVILWGFETTKTRGETIGQVLAYLGVRVVAGANPWSKQVEAIPLAELGRPRVDCHIQICGFFRDMYPNVVELINRAFALVSDLEESEAENYVRAHTVALEAELKGTVPDDQLRRVATGRVYGPRPGEYGTRTTHLIETTAWTDEQQIVDVFRASMNHLYAEKLHGVRFDEAYEGRLRRVELVSQVRDSHEYEIVDLDHYYEFFGGLARSVESVRGTAPEMLISDTTREVVRTEAVGEALNRGVRTRLLNPAWIDPLLKHDYHGAQKIGDRVENLIGFAATTHAVENWVWSAVTDRFVRDESMFERLTENNRFATEEMLRRLMEAERRGYWEATAEELDLLRNRYLQLEGTIEERIEA